MADNYRQFSAALTIKPEEREWCDQYLKDLRNITYGKREHASPDEDGTLPRYESCADFEYEVEETSVWFHSDEGGNVDHIADFVQEYFLKFDPTGSFALSWADTCSRPRLDEFSGGAIFVTATNVKYIEAQNWISRQEEALQKKRRRAKPKRKKKP